MKLNENPFRPNLQMSILTNKINFSAGVAVKCKPQQTCCASAYLICIINYQILVTFFTIALLKQESNIN